jgi:hypothetical protein
LSSSIFFATGVAVDFGVADGVGVLDDDGEAVTIGGKLGTGLVVSSGVTVISGIAVPLGTGGVGVSLIALEPPRDRERGPGLIARTGSK